MPATLIVAIRAVAEPDHPDPASDVRQRGVSADDEGISEPSFFQGYSHKQADSSHPSELREPDEANCVDERALEKRQVGLLCGGRVNLGSV